MTRGRRVLLLNPPMRCADPQPSQGGRSERPSMLRPLIHLPELQAKAARDGKRGLLPSRYYLVRGIAVVRSGDRRGPPGCRLRQPCYIGRSKPQP